MCGNSLEWNAVPPWHFGLKVCSVIGFPTSEGCFHATSIFASWKSTLVAFILKTSWNTIYVIFKPLHFWEENLSQEITRCNPVFLNILLSFQIPCLQKTWEHQLFNKKMWLVLISCIGFGNFRFALFQFSPLLKALVKKKSGVIPPSLF